jgi:RimJ/RimL family protein N-acetyltransferase
MSAEAATAGESLDVPVDLRLRALEQSDRAAVLSVMDAWWGRPAAHLLPSPFFSEFRETSFVLERDGEIIGFLVGLLSQTRRDEAYIHAAAVAPGERRNGLGRLLYRHFFTVALRFGRRRVRAVTSSENAASIAFHNRLGFAATGRAPGRADRVELGLELVPRAPAGQPTAPDVRAACAALHVPMTGMIVALEPLTPRHEADLWRAAQDGDVWRWMPLDGGSSRAAFRRWLDWVLANAALEPAAPFAVVDRESGGAIGSTTYHAIAPEHRRLEIGMTWYGARTWQSGANVEAKLLMLEHAFDDLAYRRVEFKTDARNTRSRRALEALPARLEGVFRNHMIVRDGQPRDSAYYGIVDEEWPDVRANLARRLRARSG